MGYGTTRTTDWDTMMHWTMETVYSEAVDAVVLDTSVLVEVRPEVPMDGDVRLPSRGHRYFRTFVEIETSCDRLDFTPEAARDLAAKLIAAADVAEAADAKDVDACGHWYPCPACGAEVAR